MIRIKKIRTTFLDNLKFQENKETFFFSSQDYEEEILKEMVIKTRVCIQHTRQPQQKTFAFYIFFSSHLQHENIKQ